MRLHEWIPPQEVFDLVQGRDARRSRRAVLVEHPDIGPQQLIHVVFRQDPAHPPSLWNVHTVPELAQKRQDGRKRLTEAMIWFNDARAHPDPKFFNRQGAKDATGCGSGEWVTTAWRPPVAPWR
jgi:hypothetical protein